MSRFLNLSRFFLIVSNVSTEGSTFMFMNVNFFSYEKGGSVSRARWKGCAFDVKEVELK